MEYKTLVKKIFDEFELQTQDLAEEFKNAKWDFANASFFSNGVGARTAKILTKYIPKALDDGVITTEQAQQLVGAIMKKSSVLVDEASNLAQLELLKQEEIRLRALESGKRYVDDRIINLVKKYGEYDDHIKGDWLLGKDVQQNFAKSVVVDTLKRNSKNISRAGVKVKIKRHGGAGCCQYCSSISGEWNAENAPDTTWSFHKGCTCSIEYSTPYYTDFIHFETDKESGQTTKVTETRN